MSIYTLHVWPPKWDLHSLDPTCLATVMYLQLTIPGRFKVVSSTDPDQSPNGQLPFLTHGHTVISSFPSIIKFVSSLAKTSSTSGVVDLDASLNTLQQAERVALYAHIESFIADLVTHCFYGNDTNFWELTCPTLAGEMSFPQKYYVPRRLRETHRVRLEAAGLWSTSHTVEEPKDLFQKIKEKQDYKVTFTRAFEREKILESAKTFLKLHTYRLEQNPFYFGDRPASLDVYFAAHILLLVDPPFPDAVFQIQLSESFPGLIQHARRVQAEVARVPTYEHSTPSGSLLHSLVPRPFGGGVSPNKLDPADRKHLKKSIMFVVATAAMVTLYWGRLMFADTVEEDQDGEDDEDEDADEEEPFAGEDS